MLTIDDKLKKINNILIVLLIFFIIFSSALNYTHIPFWFSYLKDAIIFYFGFLLILKRKEAIKPKINISFYILFIIIAIISWLGLYYSTNTGLFSIISHSLRYIEFFILFFVFTNLEKLCNIKYEKLINLYLILSIILLFVHLFGYFIPNDIVSIYITDKFEHGFYRNRISIGQPAIAIFPMIISYFYILIFNKLDVKNIVKIILLLIGTVIAIPVTGIISVVICTIGLLGWSIIKSKKDIIGKILITITSIIVVIFIGILFIKTNPTLNEIYENQKDLLEVKIGSVLGNEVEDPSINIRDDKYKEVISNNTNIFQNIFGIGKYGYNRGEVSIGNLENSYRIFRVEYGYLGLAAFVIFLFSNILIYIYKSLKEKQNSKKYIFISILFIILALHAYTLDVIYLPTISYTMSLFYCYILRKDFKDENINS